MAFELSVVVLSAGYTLAFLCHRMHKLPLLSGFLRRANTAGMPKLTALEMHSGRCFCPLNLV